MIYGAISLEKKASNPEFSVNEIRMFVHDFIFSVMRSFFLNQQFIIWNVVVDCGIYNIAT